MVAVAFETGRNSESYQTRRKTVIFKVLGAQIELSILHCKQKGEVAVNIQVYIVVVGVNIVLNFEFRF